MGLEALKRYAIAQDFEEKPKPQQTETGILTAHIEREKQSQELFKKVADNIRLSEILRCKINKDVIAGADTYSLLLDAIKCISLMTGDTVFYEQNIKALKEREK